MWYRDYILYEILKDIVILGTLIFILFFHSDTKLEFSVNILHGFIVYLKNNFILS